MRARSRPTPASQILAARRSVRGRRRRATALVEASGALKVVAVSLTKIANDLRLMGSGPRAGLAEIFLPELQKGSSIMPGKVNPVIPEVVTQVAAQVIGNDAAITVGGMQGHFELNVFVPVIARNLLDSITLLASASRLLAEKCVDGIEANREQCERYAELTLSAATALNPYIGYDLATEIVKEAAASGARCARSRASRASTRRRSTTRSTTARWRSAAASSRTTAFRLRAVHERSRGEGPCGGPRARYVRVQDAGAEACVVIALSLVLALAFGDRRARRGHDRGRSDYDDGKAAPAASSVSVAGARRRTRRSAARCRRSLPQVGDVRRLARRRRPAPASTTSRSYLAPRVGEHIEVWTATVSPTSTDDPGDDSTDLDFPAGDCRNDERTQITDEQVAYFVEQFD